MTIKSDIKKLLSISFPISLSQLGHVTVGFIDSVLAGNIGEKELAAVTISNSIFFPLLTLLIGFSSGITPMVAFEFGKKAIHSMKYLHANSVISNILITLMIYLFMFLFGNWIISLYQHPEVQDICGPFYQVFLLSIFPIAFFQTFKQYAEAVGHTKSASVVTIACNFLNVVLSFYLVNLMGFIGIAWATFISRTLMAFGYLILFIYNPKFKEYRISTTQILAMTNIATLQKIAKISFPYGLQMLIEASAFGLAGLLAVKIGIIEGDSHQIALQIASVVYMISTGLGAGATVVIGQELGAQRFDKLKPLITATMVSMLIYNIFTASFILVFRKDLSMLFSDSVQIVSLSTHLLLFAASFQFFDGLQVACIGILRGIKDVTAPTIYVFLAYWVIAIPIGYVLTFQYKLGVDGIWYGLVLGLFLVSLALYLRIMFRIRKFKFH